MIIERLSQRHVQVSLAVVAVSSGFLLATIHIFPRDPLGALFCATIVLAAVIGLGKHVAPWGVNAATTLALPSVRGGILKFFLYSFYILAYIIPAVLAWGVLALVLYPLNALVSIGIFGGWLYAVTFGLMETLAIPFRALGSSWQVPARWLQGRSPFVQMLVWGSTLGPGFMTRNPYAGIWLLPLLLILHANIWLNIEVGIVIGMIHGVSRAVGILVARRRLNTCGSSMLLHLAQWRWRLADGLLLLFIAGCITSLLLAPLSKLSH